MDVECWLAGQDNADERSYPATATTELLDRNWRRWRAATRWNDHSRTWRFLRQKL